MRSTLQAQMTTLAEAMVGDLVMLNLLNHQAHCIIIGQDADNKIIALLDAIEADAPRFSFFPRRNDAYCLNYGSQWIVGPIFDEASRPGHNVRRNQPGVLHLSGDSYFVTFTPRDNFNDSINFNLTTSEEVDNLPASVISFGSWDVWFNDHIFERGNVSIQVRT